MVFIFEVPQGVPQFRVGKNFYLQGGAPPYEGDLQTLIRTGQTFGEETFGMVKNGTGHDRYVQNILLCFPTSNTRLFIVVFLCVDNTSWD